MPSGMGEGGGLRFFYGPIEGDYGKVDFSAEKE